jgi:hypothetical protein
MKKILALVAAVSVSLTGCGSHSGGPVVQTKSASGVSQTTAEVKTDEKGHTTEQNNIIERLKRDNEPGSIKHLYLISAHSGQVILYSPVKGKVTSSGKRLTPTSVAAGQHSSQGYNELPYGIPVNLSGNRYRTTEVLQDDGTYGSSIEYLYWFSPNGRFYQIYRSAGTEIVISDQPIAAIKNITMNLEITEKK